MNITTTTTKLKVTGNYGVHYYYSNIYYNGKLSFTNFFNKDKVFIRSIDRRVDPTSWPSVK